MSTPYLPDGVYFPEDSGQLVLKLTDTYNKISSSVNQRTIGAFTADELPAGNKYQLSSQFSSSFQVVITTGALLNTAASTTAHGLDIGDTWTLLRAYGAANDPSGNNYIPLPYSSSVLADNIQLDVDATNITITTGSDRTNFTTSYVILEFIR